MDGGFRYAGTGQHGEHTPSPLGDRVDLRSVARRHLLWSKFYEVHAVWMAAMGGPWFNAQAVIALHYSALHLVDAWLVGAKAIICTRHEEQDTAIAHSEELKGTPVGEYYKQLRNYSETARYRMKVYTRETYECVLQVEYHTIKRTVGRLIVDARLATLEEMKHRQTLFAEMANETKEASNHE